MFPDGVISGIFEGKDGPSAPTVRQTFALTSEGAEDPAVTAARTQKTDLRVALAAALIGLCAGAWIEWRAK